MKKPYDGFVSHMVEQQAINTTGTDHVVKKKQKEARASACEDDRESRMYDIDADNTNDSDPASLRF